MCLDLDLLKHYFWLRLSPDFDRFHRFRHRSFFGKINPKPNFYFYFFFFSGLSSLKFRFKAFGCYGDTCLSSNLLPLSALGDCHSYYHFWCFGQDNIYHFISQGKTIMTSASSC